MRKKSCELCGGVPRIYCESDDASLCWDCDEKVHAANFLVAKHTRCLLCVLCHTLTPWMASAPRLGSTVSLCNTCNIHRQQHRSAGTNGRDDYEDLYDDDDGESYDDDEEEECGDDDDEDAENQVVPAAGMAEKLSEVLASSSSSISSRDEVFSRSGAPATKRTRQSFDRLSSDDEIPCASSEQTDNPRPSKHHKEDDHGVESESGSTARISSLQRLYGEMVTNGEDRSIHRDPCYLRYERRS